MITFLDKFLKEKYLIETKDKNNLVFPSSDQIKHYETLNSTSRIDNYHCLVTKYRITNAINRAFNFQEKT